MVLGDDDDDVSLRSRQTQICPSDFPCTLLDNLQSFVATAKTEAKASLKLGHRVCSLSARKVDLGLQTQVCLWVTQLVG